MPADAPRRVKTLLVAALAVLLLAARLATPYGFMPGEAGGRLALVACPEVAPAPMPGMPHHHDQPKAKPTCPFAAAAGIGGDLPLPIVVAMALPPEPLAAPTAATSRPLPLLRGTRPPATGPPSA